MKQRTAEWIEKAEGDWAISERERHAPEPVWDGICFHVQQCAEKYLKAFLEEHGIAFGKTHDLFYLVDLAGDRLLPLHQMRDDLARLSVFGIAARYPGVRADEQAADEAMQIAAKVRAFIRTELGLLQ
jgi:HEPN domain-containing protein